MKELLVLAALAAQPASQPADQSQRMKPLPNTQQQMAWICHSTGEQVAGDNKICYYDCNGSAAAITVRWSQICPMSINR